MSDLREEEFRRALGAFASGVTVVTGHAADGRPVGLTVSAFCSVSLEPPLVLVCLARGTRSVSDLATEREIGINVLDVTQSDLSERFADPLVPDRFEGVAWRLGNSGCPLLDDALVGMECRRTNVHDEGDHLIVVARVLHVRWRDAGRPLTRYRGAYGTIEAAD